MIRPSRLAPVALAGAAAVAVLGGTAFTAGNDVADQSFGQGVGVVSGFQVSNVAYTTNTDIPDPRVTYFNFDIVRTDTTTYAKVLPSNATVKIRLNLGAGTFSSPVTCEVDALGDAAVCVTNSLNARVSTIEGLSVLAYDTVPEV